MLASLDSSLVCGFIKASHRCPFVLWKSTQIARGSAECEGATSIVLSASTVYPLVATDVLKLRSRSTGTGMVGHNGTVVSFTCTRIGDDWGA